MFQQQKQHHAADEDAIRRLGALERAALIAQIEHSCEVLERELAHRRSAQAATPRAVAAAMGEFVAVTASILLALAAVGVLL